MKGEEIITIADDEPAVTLPMLGTKVNYHPDGSLSVVVVAGPKLYGTVDVPKEDLDKLRKGIQP